MTRDTFVSTPSVHLQPADLRASLHKPAGGDPSAVLELGPGLTMYVFDPAVLVMLVEIVVHARDLLLAEISCQEMLPVDTFPDDVTHADEPLVDAQASSWVL